MKFFTVLVCLAGIGFLAGCGKDKRIGSSTLTGTWELRRTQSMALTDYPAGNGNTYKFTSTTYEKYSNGTLVKTGSYFVVKDFAVSQSIGLVVPAGQYNNRIIFDNDFISAKTFFEIEDNKLTMVSGFFPTDGGVWRIYEKQ